MIVCQNDPLRPRSARNPLRPAKGRAEYRGNIMLADLTYCIFDGTLTGYVNRAFFSIEAVSGGGAGSTLRKASDSANNPYMEGLKTTGSAHAVGHRHGGPIPPGKY